MNTIESEVHQQKIRIEASKITTAPLLRKGWTLVFTGWAIGLIPLIGFAGWIMAIACALIIGVLVISRGNSSQGLGLLLTGWLGTIPVAIVTVLFWMLFGLGGVGFLSGFI